MAKVVINSCYGGFGLSDEAIVRYAELKGIKLYIDKSDTWFTKFYTERSMNNDSYYSPNIPRDDPDLLQVIDELGVKANGECAKLSIVEIPDNVKWQIEEYDGYEHVAEQHRTWG